MARWCKIYYIHIYQLRYKYENKEVTVQIFYNSLYILTLHKTAGNDHRLNVESRYYSHIKAVTINQILTCHQIAHFFISSKPDRTLQFNNRDIC